MLRTAVIVLVVAALLAAGAAAGYVSLASVGHEPQATWLVGWLQSFSTNMVAAAVTFVLLNLIVGEFEKRQQREMTKTQLTIGLHTDFQSSDMLRARIRAENILVENARSKSPLNTEALYEKLHKQQKQEDDWLCVLRVLHFFENLGKLHLAGALSPSLTKEFFESYLKDYFENESLGELANASPGNNWAPPVIQLANAWGIDTSRSWAIATTSGEVDAEPLNAADRPPAAGG